MTQAHPIIPPPELVQQWINEEQGVFAEHIATQAARWGADQELEACCELLDGESLPPKRSCGKWLRNRRRPKPPSLKEQALTLLDDCSDRIDAAHENTIRRALESLPE